MRIDFRLANLFDIDMHRDFHHPANMLEEHPDIFSFLTNYNPGPRRVDCDPCCLRWPVNVNPTNGGLCKLFTNKVANLEVNLQMFGISWPLGVPHRGMVFDDAQSHA